MSVHDRIPPTLDLSPNIPRYTYEFDGRRIEDETTPRVCFCPTIIGCLMAISSAEKPEDLDVTSNVGVIIYGTKVIEESFYPYSMSCDEAKEKPNGFSFKHIVPDCNVTGEVWSLNPIRVDLLFVCRFDLMSTAESIQYFALWQAQYYRWKADKNEKKT